MIYDVNVSFKVENTSEFWHFFDKNRDTIENTIENTIEEMRQDDRTFMFTFLFIISFFVIFCYCRLWRKSTTIDVTM